MRSIRWTYVFLLAFGFLLCGCNGGSNSNSTLLPPSGLSYAVSAATYTVGTAITADTPTVSGGAVTSYSVTPALPSGLSLNSSTGAMSGTPTKVSAAANYTITASNAAGSATATVSITVNPAAPATLSYATNPALYNIGVAIPLNTPTNTGGAIASYSMVPTLPWGLSLNSATGTIGGTPAVAAAETAYTVSAYNAGGSTSVTLSITVTNGAPANLTYSNTAPTYTAQTPIPVNLPAYSGGEPAQFLVNPVLPDGLALNPTSGAISGMPAGTSPASIYMVTAKNAFGSATASLRIAVDAQTAALTYSPSTVVYTAGQAITPLAVSNGVSGNYSVTPPLPDGLTLDSSSGTISGTPTNVDRDGDIYRHGIDLRRQRDGSSQHYGGRCGSVAAKHTEYGSDHHAAGAGRIAVSTTQSRSRGQSGVAGLARRHHRGQSRWQHLCWSSPAATIAYSIWAATR